MKFSKQQIVKAVAVGAAALLIGLSQLGVLPDLGVSKFLLDAVGYSTPAAAPAAGAK
jgi:hypothetical protein